MVANDAEWCLLIHDKYIRLILDRKKVWEVRTQRLFEIGERIALGNTKTKLIEGYATVSDIKKMSVAEMKQYNEKHLASDFIDGYVSKRKKPVEHLYAFVLTDVVANVKVKAYTPSNGFPKVRLR
jgi:hypothetical protein